MKSSRITFFTLLSKKLCNKHQEIYTIQTVPKNNVGRPSWFIKQCFAVSGPLLLTITIGMTLGYSAILLPQLELQTTVPSIRINQEQASWLASLAVIPMAFGTLIGGLLIEKFGRKMTHVIVCLPLCFGWILMGFSQNIEMLLSSRILTGFCCGIITPATNVYIGETAAPKYRGILLGGVGLSVSIGLLIIHLLGTFLTWNLTALITSSLPIFSWLLLNFSPESPVWLAEHNNKEKATKAFTWLHGDSETVKPELDVILNKNPNCQMKKFQLKDLLVAEFLKPLTILIVFFVTTQGAGANAINFYSVTFMKQTLGTNFNEYLITIIVDCIRVVASVVLCILLRSQRRRVLTLICSFGTVFPLFILSLFIYLSDLNPQLAEIYSLQTIPLISIIIYIIFISGFVALPWGLIGELFPLVKRSIGSGIVSCVAYLTIFGVVKMMPAMFERLGIDGTFLVYGSVALIGTVFLFVYLPETKGKTLNEVEEYFKNKKNEECEIREIDKY